MKKILIRNIQIYEYIQNKDRFLKEAPSEDSFFFEAFNENIDVANEVLNSDYLDSMKKNMLEPQYFGALTVLDSYYCYRAEETLLSLLCKIDKGKEPELYELVVALKKGYEAYNRTFFEDWHIRTAESVNPTEIFKEYAEHEHNIMCAYEPIYTLVAILPCYYLWPWFASRILKSKDYISGVYASWLKDCGNEESYETAYELGNFIENWIKAGKPFDREKAKSIYKISMEYESKAFKNAYEKNQTSYSN